MLKQVSSSAFYDTNMYYNKLTKQHPAPSVLPLVQYILQQNSMYHILACCPSSSHSDNDHRHPSNGKIVANLLVIGRGIAEIWGQEHGRPFMKRCAPGMQVQAMQVQADFHGISRIDGDCYPWIFLCNELWSRVGFHKMVRMSGAFHSAILNVKHSYKPEFFPLQRKREIYHPPSNIPLRDLGN